RCGRWVCTWSRRSAAGPSPESELSSRTALRWPRTCGSFRSSSTGRKARQARCNEVISKRTWRTPPEYRYNPGGERIKKQTAAGDAWYVNQYFVLLPNNLPTKHIFAGET